jgi:hypothetical protein
MADQRDDDAAAIAQEQVTRTAISVAVNIGAILAVNWLYLHADDVKDRAQALAELARRRRRGGALPADAGLQAREFARAVSAYDHGDRS